MADVQIVLRIKILYTFSLMFDYNDGITSTNLKNQFEGDSDKPLQIYYISHRRNRRWRWRKRKTKRKCKFDEDESLDEAIVPVKFVGKEDIGLFFFPQCQGTTSALFHQLMHLSCIIRLLLAVGPPGFTKGD
jgi:hypothetical protein